MEKPLLSGQTSGHGGERSRASFTRRSDAITFGSPYQKAAALVDLVRFSHLFTVRDLNSQLKPNSFPLRYDEFVPNLELYTL